MLPEICEFEELDKTKSTTYNNTTHELHQKVDLGRNLSTITVSSIFNNIGLSAHLDILTKLQVSEKFDSLHSRLTSVESSCKFRVEPLALLKA